MSPNTVRTLRQTVAEAGAVTALRDRVWTTAGYGSLAPGVLHAIDATIGGLVLTGATAPAAAKSLRRHFPNLPLLIAPTSAAERAATPEEPFVLENGSDVLFEETVGEALDRQRTAGADMVITPSGQIGAQDSPSLKAVIARANAIGDRDVLTLVVVPSIWLTEPWVTTLSTVLRDSVHPVLLGLAHSFDNPLGDKRTLAGYQRLAQEVEAVVGWHTDLSGLGLIAQGGLGAAIGLRPSGRRFAQLGLHPQASDKRDKTPHVLLPEMMRYTRTSYMQNEWFAGTISDTCGSACCDGQAVDRFDDSDSAIDAAHVHNTTRLYEMAKALSVVSPTARADWWRSRVNDGITAHAELGARIRREVKAPSDLQGWANLISA